MAGTVQSKNVLEVLGSYIKDWLAKIYTRMYSVLSKSHDAVPRNVARSVEQQAKGRLAVPPGAASFLVVMVK